MESKRLYWWIYVQGRNGDLDVENGLVDTVGEEQSGTNGESSSSNVIPDWNIILFHVSVLMMPR